MMGRRGFLKAIGAGVLGMALALKVPERETESEISLRFIKQWNAAQADGISRFDVLCGFGVINPDFVVRVQSA